MLREACCVTRETSRNTLRARPQEILKTQKIEQLPDCHASRLKALRAGNCSCQSGNAAEFVCGRFVNGA